jgi:hypothetical protein
VEDGRVLPHTSPRAGRGRGWERADARALAAPDLRLQPRHTPQFGRPIAFKLIEAAGDRWRAVNAPQLVALVRAGAVFVNGKLVGRPDETPRPEAV